MNSDQSNVRMVNHKISGPKWMDENRTTIQFSKLFPTRALHRPRRATAVDNLWVPPICRRPSDATLE